MLINLPISIQHVASVVLGRRTCIARVIVGLSKAEVGSYC